jgi:hypothetical protein
MSRLREEQKAAMSRLREEPNTAMSGWREEQMSLKSAGAFGHPITR